MFSFNEIAPIKRRTIDHFVAQLIIKVYNYRAYIYTGTFLSFLILKASLPMILYRQESHFIETIGRFVHSLFYVRAYFIV